MSECGGNKDVVSQYRITLARRASQPASQPANQERFSPVWIFVMMGVVRNNTHHLQKVRAIYRNGCGECVVPAPRLHTQWYTHKLFISLLRLFTCVIGKATSASLCHYSTVSLLSILLCCVARRQDIGS